jgi:hypothetical protein
MDDLVDPGSSQVASTIWRMRVSCSPRLMPFLLTSGLMIPKRKRETARRVSWSMDVPPRTTFTVQGGSVAASLR